MTLLNALLHGQAVHLFTDGLALGPDGRRLALAKVFPVPHLGAALATRGSAPFLAAVTLEAMMAADTFDAAAAGLGGFVRAVAEGENGRLFPPGRQEVALAGFSERRARPEIHLAATVPLGESWAAFAGGQVAAFTAPDDGTVLPMLTGMGYGDGDRFDPLAAGLALAERQRAIPDAGVGLFVQHTRVARDGIETRIVRRWPVEHRGIASVERVPA